MVFNHHHVKPLLLAISAAALLAAPLHAETAARNTAHNKDLAYHAFFSGADEILALTAAGASPAATDAEGVPVLCLAAKRKNTQGLDVIKALLASGADIDHSDKKGETALFCAAKAGNLDGVRLLLESGADYYHTNTDNNIARNLAYQLGNMEVFTFMDEFINQKRSHVLKAYDERNQELIDAEAKLEAAKQAMEEKEAEMETREQELTNAAQQQQEVTKAQAAAEKAEENKAPTMDESTFSTAVQQLSYHACAEQYWTFARQLNLASDLSGTAMMQAIAEHRQTLGDYRQQVHDAYQTGPRYTNKIIKPSKAAIKQAMQSLGSNVTRRSHGMGDAADAKKRCTEIANSWLIEMPEEQDDTL